MKFGKMRIEKGEVKFTKLMKPCQLPCTDIIWAYRRKEDSNSKMCCGTVAFTTNFIMILTKRGKRYRFEMTEDEAKACLVYLKDANEDLIVGFPKGAPLPLNSSYNTRDLGGYHCDNGRYILPHRLLRSGDLYHLSQDDGKLLTDEYHLSCVIDFRTDLEKEQKPDTELSGVLYIEDPILEADTMGVTREGDFLEHLLTLDENPEKYMIEIYQKLVLDDNAQNGYAKFFEYLLEFGSRGSVLWHCTAGKDRAGVASMLVLAALGASRSTIMDDYIRTNVALKQEVDYMVRLLQSKGAGEQAVEMVRTMLSARESYMQSALNSITSEYGSMERYLRKAICLTPRHITRLKEQYLVH